jgi:hypothetical protein
MAATLKLAAIQTLTIFSDNHWVGDNSYLSCNHLLLYCIVALVILFHRIKPR